MMQYGEKSDRPVVPEKGANKELGQPGLAERLEERGLAKENSYEQSTFWTQNQVDMTHALERIREVEKMNNFRLKTKRYYPRQEPGAVILHAGICAGGGP